MMNNTNSQLIIFTDLDGTLLDLNTYSYKGAESALRKIQDENIPLVFCSSKTRTEQEFYQTELEIKAPFIVENGGAIFIRSDYFNFDYEYQKSNVNYHIIEIGMPVTKVREKLLKIRSDNGFSFKGYGDMTVEEVSALTGLDLEAAGRARSRDYSETISLSDSANELRKFEKSLQKEGMQCAHGGRFLTVTGKSNDKGRAVRLLKKFYRKAFAVIATVGIGDAMNDLPLLAEVDHPILLQRAEENWQGFDLPNLRKISGSGPEVWGQLMTELLETEVGMCG